jgi:hypothetical protein
MLYIIDIQYYPFGERKILKEAAIMHLIHPLQVKHFAFRAPFPFHWLSPKDVKSSNYLCNVLGLLHWNEGSQEESDFTTSMPSGSIILCNGLEKSLFLQSLFPLCKVVNVNLSFPSPSYTPSHIQCPLHSHKLCAITRVYQLYELCNKQSEE